MATNEKIAKEYDFSGGNVDYMSKVDFIASLDKARADRDKKWSNTIRQIFNELDKYKGWAIPQKNLLACIDEWGKANTDEEAKAIFNKYLTLMISDKDYQVLRKRQLEKFVKKKLGVLK